MVSNYLQNLFNYHWQLVIYPINCKVAIAEQKIDWTKRHSEQKTLKATGNPIAKQLNSWYSNLFAVKFEVV